MRDASGRRCTSARPATCARACARTSARAGSRRARGRARRARPRRLGAPRLRARGGARRARPDPPLAAAGERARHASRRGRLPAARRWPIPCRRSGCATAVRDDGALYAGPFPSRRLATEAAEALRDAFGLRTCRPRVPVDDGRCLRGRRALPRALPRRRRELGLRRSARGWPPGGPREAVLDAPLRARLAPLVAAAALRGGARAPRACWMPCAPCRCAGRGASGARGTARAPAGVRPRPAPWSRFAVRAGALVG